MPQVDRAIVKARAAELRAVAAATQAEWLATLVDKPLSVLAERDGSGYAENFARVALPEGIASGTIATLTPRAIEGRLLV